MNLTKPNSDISETIANHMEIAMSEVFGIKPKVKTWKFTIRYLDGSKAEPSFKAESVEKARKALDYWFPGYDIELGCKELA